MGKISVPLFHTQLFRCPLFFSLAVGSLSTHFYLYTCRYMEAPIVAMATFVTLAME